MRVTTTHSVHLDLTVGQHSPITAAGRAACDVDLAIGCQLVVWFSFSHAFDVNPVPVSNECGACDGIGSIFVLEVEDDLAELHFVLRGRALQIEIKFVALDAWRIENFQLVVLANKIKL